MARTRRLFGTDGIRGKANADPMTAETALRLGQAAGLRFTRGSHRHRVVIGKDTRLSGYMIEPALTAGFIGAAPVTAQRGKNLVRRAGLRLPVVITHQTRRHILCPSSQS